ncbi:MAG: hypothetical protein KGL39_48855 [Patescibacteria group bacterium]|nr:hypothetical protein [Patescibacteria group bacterium]
MRKCLYPPCSEELEVGQIGPYCCQEHRFLDAQPKENEHAPIMHANGYEPPAPRHPGVWGKRPKRAH